MKELDIFMVVDESGSMTSRRDWVLEAYDDFFKRHKELQVGEDEVCRVSVYFFHETIRCLYPHVLLEEAPPLDSHDYRPSGSTALYDSLLVVLEDVDRTAALRPEGKRLVVVVTDGMNTSGVARAEDLRAKLDNVNVPVEMVYMGSNQDAILQGERVGSGRGSSLQYEDDHFLDAMFSMTSAVARMRSGETQTVEFTHVERSRSAGTEQDGGSSLDPWDPWESRINIGMVMPPPPTLSRHQTMSSELRSNSGDTVDIL